MMDLTPVQELYRQLTESNNSVGGLDFWALSPDTQINLLCGMSNILTLPLSQQHSHRDDGWDTKANQHAILIAALTEKYRNLSPTQEPTLEVTRNFSKRSQVIFHEICLKPRFKLKNVTFKLFVDCFFILCL